MSSKNSFSLKRLVGKRQGSSKRVKGGDDDDGESLADKFGLFLLNPQTVDTASIEGAQELYDVDIVAVHGLGGDAYKTWTHENGKLWLRDFLPDQLPGARIFCMHMTRHLCSPVTRELCETTLE